MGSSRSSGVTGCGCGRPIRQRPLRHPIDVFLASLAEHAGEHAIGIILSGSGTDGTLGVKAIKERGGLTIAQGADHVAASI